MKLHVVPFLALAVGCATLEHTDPKTGEVIKVNLGVKGCVSLERTAKETRIQVEHDGMSSALAGTIRAVTSAAGSVFGGEREDAGPPQAGEGCSPSTPPAEERRVIGEILAPPSPREVLR